jgi:hypothetical protein
LILQSAGDDFRSRGRAAIDQRSLIWLRKRAGLARSTFAYCIGFLVSSSTSIGVFLTTQAVLRAPALDADRIIGSGLFCAVIGPALGVLAAKRLRPSVQERT